MSGTSAISATSRRELSSSFFFLQGKAPNEIHAILTETFASFLPGRAKDLSAPLYYIIIAATFMQSIYSYIPETNQVSRVYSVTAVFFFFILLTVHLNIFIY